MPHATLLHTKHTVSCSLLDKLDSPLLYTVKAAVPPGGHLHSPWLWSVLLIVQTVFSQDGWSGREEGPEEGDEGGAGGAGEGGQGGAVQEAGGQADCQEGVQGGQVGGHHPLPLD